LTKIVFDNYHQLPKSSESKILGYKNHCAAQISSLRQSERALAVRNELSFVDPRMAGKFKGSIRNLKKTYYQMKSPGFTQHFVIEKYFIFLCQLLDPINFSCLKAKALTWGRKTWRRALKDVARTKSRKRLWAMGPGRGEGCKNLGGDIWFCIFTFVDGDVDIEKKINEQLQLT